MSISFRIVQSPFSDLCSLRNSGNAYCVLSDTIQGEAVGPSAVSDGSAQSYLAQPVDGATISAENGQTSIVLPIDVEVSEPSLDEHLKQDPLLGKQ
jgi:tRNA (adenine-N(1)-)-methyltransferase non-catalytic subunit